MRKNQNHKISLKNKIQCEPYLYTYRMSFIYLFFRYKFWTSKTFFTCRDDDTALQILNRKYNLVRREGGYRNKSFHSRQHPFNHSDQTA